MKHPLVTEFPIILKVANCCLLKYKYTVFAEPATVQMLMVMFVKRMVRTGPIIVAVVLYRPLRSSLFMKDIIPVHIMRDATTAGFSAGLF